MIELSSTITTRLIDHMGGDHSFVAAARTSTSGEEALRWLDEPAEENYGLVNYLLQQRHGGPLEAAVFQFYVHAPVFVFRQIHRHRIASHSEESARYHPLRPLYWIPKRDRPMVPAPGYKSARPRFVTLDEAIREKRPELDYPAVTREADAWYAREVERNRQVYQLAHDNYLASIADGIGLEVARVKLPVAIYSSGWMTINVRSLLNFLSLRIHSPSATTLSYPQLETQEVARMCEDILKEHCPLVHKAWSENGRGSP